MLLRKIITKFHMTGKKSYPGFFAFCLLYKKMPAFVGNGCSYRDRQKSIPTPFVGKLKLRDQNYFCQNLVIFYFKKGSTSGTYWFEHQTTCILLKNWSKRQVFSIPSMPFKNSDISLENVYRPCKNGDLFLYIHLPMMIMMQIIAWYESLSFPTKGLLLLFWMPFRRSL